MSEWNSHKIVMPTIPIGSFWGCRAVISVWFPVETCGMLRCMVHFAKDFSIFHEKCAGLVWFHYEPAMIVLTCGASSFRRIT